MPQELTTTFGWTVGVKELDGGTTSINALVNEGLKMVRDRKMQEITAQRKQRNTSQSMTAS